MGKLILRILLAMAVVFVAAPLMAHAEEAIRLFDVRATLAQDRTATIEERITYDFGEGTRHGIFRLIPDVYDRNGGTYKLHLNIKDVQMDGASVPYQVQTQNRDIEVKIGDPTQHVTGLHTYLIQYTTNRSLNDFPDHIEWYWNITGNGWLVPIEKASLALTAPSSTQRTCFIGLFGSQEPGCTWADAGSVVQVSSTRILSDGEGMTVVFGFPREAFSSLSIGQRLTWFLQDNLWIGLPIIVFFLMWFTWYRYGKEPRGCGTVIPQYEEPRALPPALQSTLVYQHFSPRAVTSTILDLARRGYLKVIWETEKDVAFIQEKPADASLHAYEKEVFEGLFADGGIPARPTGLKETFYKAVNKARSSLFKELKTYGWFDANPAAVRAIWMGIAVAVTLLLIVFFEQLPLQMVSSVMSGIIVAAFGWHMPRMSKEGAIVAEEIQGFRWFLSVTEEKRLEFTDAPAKKPEQFARFLPAAVAFGIERQWAHHFDGMQIPPPTYMEGAWQGWSALQIANAVDAMHHNNVSNMYTAPSSAGGGGSGFSGGGSGGGFGGGGGGSW